VAIETSLGAFEVRRAVAILALADTGRAEQQVTTLRQDRIVVAAVAHQARVRAGEREGGPGVIERGKHEAFLSVAGLASRREGWPPSFPGRLGVDVLVAGGTEIDRLVADRDSRTIRKLGLLRAVAVRARDPGVAAAQRKARVPVV
jgi:hypothetical protein